jgi:hypothetical protein
MGRLWYLDYLAWLAEDEPTRKQLRFDTMSQGWVVGGRDFAKALAKEHREWAGHGPRLAAELRETQEALWADELAALLRKLRRKPAELEHIK